MGVKADPYDWEMTGIKAKDAVPTEDLIGSVMDFEEKREWMEYSIFVLQPRASRCQVVSRGLQGKLWRPFTWRRNMKEWQAINDRMEAILRIKTLP